MGKQETINILVKDVPKSINKKLKLQAIRTEKTVSLIILEMLKDKFKN